MTWILSVKRRSMAVTLLVCACSRGGSAPTLADASPPAEVAPGPAASVPRAAEPSTLPPKYQFGSNDPADPTLLEASYINLDLGITRLSVRRSGLVFLGDSGDPKPRTSVSPERAAKAVADLMKVSLCRIPSKSDGSLHDTLAIQLYTSFSTYCDVHRHERLWQESSATRAAREVIRSLDEDACEGRCPRWEEFRGPVAADREEPPPLVVTTQRPGRDPLEATVLASSRVRFRTLSFRDDDHVKWGAVSPGSVETLRVHLIADDFCNLTPKISGRRATTTVAVNMPGVACRIEMPTEDWSASPRSRSVDAAVRKLLTEACSRPCEIGGAAHP